MNNSNMSINCMTFIQKVTSAMLLLFYVSYTFGQNYGECTYDQAGNRLSRSISTGNRSSLHNNSEKKSIQPLNDGQIAGHTVHISYNQEQSCLIVEVLGLTDYDACEISLINLAGTTLLRQKLSSTWSELDLSNLRNGVYIVCLELNDERRSTKIVKK